jgi:hypothetical protein
VLAVDTNAIKNWIIVAFAAVGSGIAIKATEIGL